MNGQLEQMSYKAEHAYLHQGLGIIPSPLIEVPPIVKPTKSRKGWNSSNSDYIILLLVMWGGDGVLNATRN